MSEDEGNNLIRFTVFLIDIGGGGVTDDRATAAEPAAQDGSDWTSYARLPRGLDAVASFEKILGKTASLPGSHRCRKPSASASQPRVPPSRS